MSQRRRFLGFFAVIALAQSSIACSDVSKEPADEPGSIRGTLRSATADYFDENRHERVYALQLKDGSYVDLRFPEGPPAVRPGSEIVVYGQKWSDGVHVDRVRVIDNDEGIGTQRARLIDPTPLTPPIKAALVSVDSAWSDARAKARITTPDFIRPVLEVSSYGRWTMEWDAYGGITIPNDCSGTFYSAIGTNGVAAMKAAGINVDQYQQIQFILPNSFACSWGGFGYDGHTPLRTDGMRGTYNPWSYVKRGATTATSDPEPREGVMVQEIGHNWGLAHVHFCPNTQTPGPKCTGYSEYGSPFTPMSNGNNVYLNAWERIQMNFLAGCNVITINDTGTYDIGSLSSSCNGPQVLRIAADLSLDASTPNSQRYYYLEYRTPVGIDGTNGVLVHYSTDFKEGGWTQCDWGGPDCPEDYIISPLGTTAAQGLLQAGAEWTTPQNVKIKIVSLGDTAKFDVTFATPGPGSGTTCLDGQAWDKAAPVCKAGPPPIDAGAGGTGGTGIDAGRLDATAPPTVDAGGDKDGAAGSGSGGSSGSAGAGGGTAGNSGSGGSAGTTAGTGGSTPPKDDSGCGCRIPNTSSSRTTPTLGIVAGLGIIARLRRRSRRSRS